MDGMLDVNPCYNLLMHVLIKKRQVLVCELMPWFSPRFSWFLQMSAMIFAIFYCDFLLSLVLNQSLIWMLNSV